jgi:hypothetical protein
MKRLPKLTFFATCLVPFWPFGVLTAQDIPFVNYNYNWAEMNVQQIVNPIGSKSDILTDKAASAVLPQLLRFTPNTTQRKTNIANFVSEVAKLSPDYAPQLAAELGDGALFGQYSQMLRSMGLDANNVADNMAVWWLTAWEASAGRAIDVSPASFGVVKSQVERMLSSSKMAALTNADKQKMADDFMVRSLIMANQIDQAKSNPTFAKQLAAGTKKSTKASGLDLDAMTLTDKGFVPVKRR